MTQIENQARDGLRLGKASLEDIGGQGQPGSFCIQMSEWMRPSTRAVMFGRAV